MFPLRSERQLVGFVIATSVFIFLYLLVVEIGLAFRTEPERLAMFWPPNGFLLGVLCCVRGRWRWWASGLAFACCLVGNLAAGNSLPVSLGFTAINVAEPAVICAVGWRLRGREWSFESPGDVFGLYLLAAVVSAGSGLAGGFVITRGLGVGGYWEVSAAFWLSDTLGITLVTPVVICAASFRRSCLRTITSGRAVEAAALLGGVTLLCLTFDVPVTILARMLHLLAVFPLLLWAAVRFGFGVTAAVNLVVALATIWHSGRGNGSFADMDTTASVQFLSAQFFLSVVGVSKLALAATLRALRQTAEELRKSERRFRDVLNGAPVVTYLRGLDGRYIFINRKGGELFGIPSVEWVGRRPSEFLPAEVAEQFTRHDQDIVETLQSRTVEESAVLLGGQNVTYLTAQFPLLDTAGVPYAVCGIATDITDRKLLEEQLRQSQKMEALGQLAGGVAHDFNNLLTIINGGTEMLHRNCSPAQSELLSSVQAAGARAAELTARLLAFARRSVVTPRVIDPNATIRAAACLLRRLLPPNVAFTVQLDATAGVRLDTIQFEQVLLNLAVNARDAMPSGGRLLVATADETRPDGTEWVVVTVSDTGEGMTPEVRARLFEPFFTTKEVGKGTGLGLAAVYGIVQQAGGSIQVHSEAGQGSEFQIHLPASADLPATMESVESSPIPIHAAASGTILVVEDEDGVRTLARAVLESAGYEVLEAASATDARRLLTENAHRVRLAVCDVLMPDTGGPELAMEFAVAYPNLPILFANGFTDDRLVEVETLPTVRGFLAKPYTALGLTNAVARSLLPKE